MVYVYDFDGQPGRCVRRRRLLACYLYLRPSRPWVDILLVRMTSDSIRPPEKRYNYSNAISGLVQLVRHEGVGGLFRGLETNTVRFQ